MPGSNRRPDSQPRIADAIIDSESSPSRSPGLESISGKESTLVIVDMEEGTTSGRYHGVYLNERWWARYGCVCATIADLCSRSERTIFLVDNRFRNPDHQRIVDPLLAYAENATILHKPRDDGSKELSSRLPEDGRALVCGMNTEACVLRTARGLVRLGYDTAVISDACWSVYGAPLRRFARSHNNALSRMRIDYGMTVIDSAIAFSEEK